MKKNIVLTVLSVILLTSCEKELDLNYHSITPVDIIEATLTQSGLSIHVSETINMDDSLYHKTVAADYTLTDEQGNVVNAEDKPSEGKTYYLQVRRGEHIYTASSVMQPATTIDSCSFNWQKIGGQDHLYFKFTVNDIKGVDNYFYYSMKRNGKTYKWGTFTDKGYQDGLIERSVSCMTRETYEDNDPEDQDKILHDGDQITLEVYTIDSKAYDYWYSLNLSKQQGYNPLSNFEGGCQGVFMAGNVTKYSTVFHYSE